MGRKGGDGEEGGDLNEMFHVPSHDLRQERKKFRPEK